MEETLYRYKAFISYSHKDQKFAKWLHKKIENYKIPHALREKYPHLPKDLKRTIFIDDEELPTASALPDNLSNALESSELLIVVCSPSATQSYWVDKEIAYFKHHHGEGKVLAVLNDGEPNATHSTVYDNTLEAFPKSLRYKVNEDAELTDERTEPLAADARKGSSRKKALLKLIAGILKVDFADLWEREKKETRKRRFLFGTFFALFIAITLYASVQFWGEKGNKELEQLKQRISVIEYSIRHDNLEVAKVIALNKELKKLKKDKENKEASQKALGKLKTSLGKKANEVYRTKGAQSAIDILSSQKALANQESRLKEISKEKVALARLYEETYQFDKAEESYKMASELFFDFENGYDYANFLRRQQQHQKSITIFNTLFKKNISNIDKGFALESIGQLYQSLGRKRQAIGFFQKALSIWEQQLAIENNQGYQLKVAETLGWLGSVYYDTFEPKKALEIQKRALDIYEEIKKRDPKVYNNNVVGVLNELCKLYNIHLNDRKKALFFINKAIKIQKELVKSGSPGAKYILAALLNNSSYIYAIGNEQAFFYKDEERLALLKESLEIYRVLAKTNPLGYTPELSKQLNSVGSLYFEMKKFDYAESYYNEALSLRKKLFDINQERFSRDYIDSFLTLATFYQQITQYEKAENILLKALDIRKSLPVDNIQVHYNSLRFILEALGDLYQKMNEQNKAKTYYLEALSCYKHLEQDYMTRESLAILNQSLGFLFIDDNDWNKALEFFSNALSIYKELSVQDYDVYKKNLAWNHNMLGNIYIMMQMPDKAQEHRIKENNILKSNKK